MNQRNLPPDRSTNETIPAHGWREKPRHCPGTPGDMRHPLLDGIHYPVRN
ncbi:MAG: hypothetical protein J4O05_05110 [Chloroflexi bacterium]|nr:hypothetical protein [Chloroflexota bacterium]MCI0804688.1 hypothetical protein [Chloroflexota bacterium]MCI0834384.1 hypothetical protein [Chloroflexota bacterium]MCI0836765.1 hypothetical protein [Chloroflexota bacterium]MCI0881467.1 hypothetical protein [Chloroflexota bacterium]